MPAATIASITSPRATVKDLLLCLYDLSPLDIEVLFILLKNNEAMNLNELSSKTDRDRTNVFRSLQRLVSLGLCIKEVKILQGGGYYHIYSSIDKRTFRAELQERVKGINNALSRLLRRTEEAFT